MWFNCLEIISSFMFIQEINENKVDNRQEQWFRVLFFFLRLLFANAHLLQIYSVTFAILICEHIQQYVLVSLN